MEGSNESHRLWMYSTMVKSRHFEEKVKAAYLEGKSPRFLLSKGPLPGEMHLSDGQEPCAVGVCALLQPADFVTATHRPHHVAIAKGVDLKAMAAELFGRKAGLSGGRGGHMHLFDPKVNFSCSSIVGQGLGPAVGAALTAKMKGTDAVAVAFLGEGAANQGAFHESLNLAAVWKVPVIFVIEDNNYGISTAKADCTAIGSNADRAAAYGMPGVHVPGNDADAIYAAAEEAVSRARAGGGPSLIDIETYRLDGHFVGDPETYRPKGEVTGLRQRDPIPLYRERLLADGFERAVLERSEEEARSEVEAALQFGRDSEPPAPAEALEHVFQ